MKNLEKIFVFCEFGKKKGGRGRGEREREREVDGEKEM